MADDITYKSAGASFDPYWERHDFELGKMGFNVPGEGKNSSSGMKMMTGEEPIDEATVKLMKAVDEQGVFDTNPPDYTKNANLWKLESAHKKGKWELWNFDVAAGIIDGFKDNKFGKRMFYDYPNPKDGGTRDVEFAKVESEITINTGSCLYLNAGRGIGPLGICKTGLDRNQGVFDEVVAVESDVELHTKNKKVIEEFGLTDKFKCVNNLDLTQPSPMTADYEEYLFNKKFDCIIMALPPSNSDHGIYFQNQKRREAMARIAVQGDKPIDVGFLGVVDIYNNVDEFKVRHYDENWSRHRATYKKAKQFLNPGGVIISIHHQMMSDVEAFNGMIEDGNMEIFTHDYLYTFPWKHKSYSMFLATYAVQPSWIDFKYFITSKPKD